MSNLTSVAKYWVKWVFAIVSHYSGLLFLYGRFACRNRVSCLMYHRVLPEPLLKQSASNPSLIVSQDDFGKQMRFISRWYDTMSGDELISYVPRKRLGVVVTFDDGWKDNATYAAPLMKRHEVPAIVFLATDFIGTERTFWQEALTRSVVALWESPSVNRVNLQSIMGNPIAEDHETFRQSLVDWIENLKKLPDVNREQVVSEVEAIAGVPNAPEWDGFMSWEDVRELCDSGIEFGCHTCTHRMLTHVPSADIEEELRQSSQKIARNTGRTVRFFAYPNGDRNPEVELLVQQAGFVRAFAVEQGMIDSSSEPMALKRNMIHKGIAGTIPMFHCHLLGIF